MKILALGLLVVTAATAHTVPACINANNYTSMVVLMRAESIVARTFATAEINVEWHSGSSSACRQPGAIILDFASNTPPNEHPGALAYARVYESVHIVILFDRIEKNACSPTQLSTFLANVMTHEMTHILQRVARHSTTGVMKANWTAHDFIQMAQEPLPFAQEDIDLIQRGLQSR